MWYVLCVRALMPFHMYVVHRTMYVLYVCGSVADSTIISEAQKLWIVIIVVELTLSPALSLLVAHTHPLSPSLSDSLSLFALLFLGCIIFRVLQHAHFSKSRFHSLLSDTVFCSPSCCWCHPPSRFAHAPALSLPLYDGECAVLCVYVYLRAPAYIYQFLQYSQVFVYRLSFVFSLAIHIFTHTPNQNTTILMVSLCIFGPIWSTVL